MSRSSLSIEIIDGDNILYAPVRTHADPVFGQVWHSTVFEQKQFFGNCVGRHTEPLRPTPVFGPTCFLTTMDPSLLFSVLWASWFFLLPERKRSLGQRGLGVACDKTVRWLQASKLKRVLWARGRSTGRAGKSYAARGNFPKNIFAEF